MSADPNTAQKTATKNAAPTAPQRSSVPARQAKSAPAATTEKKEKSGLALRWEHIKQSYRDTVAELKKVNWPDRETTKNLTIVVIGISLFMGLLLGGVDYIFRTIFQALG